MKKNNESKLEENNLIYIKDENGNELEGEIIFEFEENGDEFVVYGISDVIYVARYDEEGKLFPVNEDEWPLIEKIVNDYFAEMDEE